MLACFQVELYMWPDTAVDVDCVAGGGLTTMTKEGRGGGGGSFGNSGIAAGKEV